MDYIIIFMLALFFGTALIETMLAYKSMRKAYERSIRRQIIIIPVTENMPNIEHILRETLKMTDISDFNCRVIICDLNADSETIEICKKFCDEHSVFELCPKETAKKLLQLL